MQGNRQVQVQVYNMGGEEVEKIEVSGHVFDVPLNQAVVHQVLVAQLANARQGTSSTKTRGEVAGSTAKLFRQKGTGNARAGSIKSPLRRGGGIIFGPKPRSYRQVMPKKMRRLALRCVLSAKLRDKELIVLDQLKFSQPSARAMAGVLTALRIGSSVLIATAEPEENVVKSARNLVGAKTTPASLLNVVDILSCKILLLTVGAVRKVEELWAKELTEGDGNASVRSVAEAANN